MKRYIQVAIGLLIGLILLYFLFRGVDWAKLSAALRSVSVTWLLICQVPLWLSFFTRIFRWGYIVRATAPASYRSMFSATQIGFLANFTLPGRAGEIIRPYVLNRLEGIPFLKGLALTITDRVTDIFGLLVVMTIAGLAFTPEPVTIPAELLGRPFTINAAALRTTALMTLLVPLGVVIVLVLLYINQEMVLRVSDAILKRISHKIAAFAHSLLSSFADGLHVFRSPGDMVKSVVWSLITWAMFTTSTACIIQAFHLPWPWYAPFVIQTTLAIAISLPGAPGFIGQFQAGVLAGLMMTIPDIGYEDALAIGLLAHVVNIIPIAITGVFCLAWENMGLLELQRQSEAAEAAVEQQAEDASYEDA